MQARTPQGKPVGQFLPSDDRHVTLSSCGDGQNVSTVIGFLTKCSQNC
jgi:hypothetical protein